MDNEALLEIFKNNRRVVSNVLENKTNAGTHPDDNTFAEGFGPLSYDVNVPAFIAAYTGQDARTVTKNIEQDVSQLSFIPKPNWTIRYDGLSKIPRLKDVLKSFQLKHGYKSTLAVNRFNTAPDYDPDNPYANMSQANNNYYSVLEIPAVTISEQFNPIIGVSLKTASDISFNAEWKKSRNLNLSLQSKNLSEDLSNEFVLGFGYVLKDFKGFSKKKKRRRSKRGDKDDDTANDDKTGKKNSLRDFARGGIVQNGKGRTLTMNLDLAYRDNVNLIYNLQDGTEGEPNRGSTSWNIEPSLEYQMYKNLAIRWFGRYQTSDPKNTTQGGFVAFSTGFTVRFNFN